MDNIKLKMAVEIIDNLDGDLNNPGSFAWIDPDEFSVSLRAVKQLILESCEEGA
ncbi:PKD domain containing protein [Lactobacillus phage phiLdb]|uniref:PKD domain containing protein n=1 Tax=Lactobacillus phage phiLdb TaxID=1399942 RepID=U3PBJ5_9CAUD|nr:PKD domain containing protein [Lactobacillus phage phiLdb]AGW43722.1 PKD domain containing protein [Lactobacillus phage phiLdb]